MSECTLITRTRELLREHYAQETQRQIAQRTGLTLAWINQFASKPKHEPSAVKVQRLYEYLAGKKLDVA